MITLKSDRIALANLRHWANILNERYGFNLGVAKPNQNYVITESGRRIESGERIKCIKFLFGLTIAAQIIANKGVKPAF